MHEMQTTTIDDPDVCQSVCLSCGIAVQTRLDGLRSCLDWRFSKAQKTLGFDAAFAKLLWPIIVFLCDMFYLLKVQIS